MLLLAKVEKYILAKLLQGFRQQVTWQTLLGGGKNLDHVYLKGNMGIEVQKPSLLLQWSQCEPGESLLLGEKYLKQQRLLLEQYCYDFICHPHV